MTTNKTMRLLLAATAVSLALGGAVTLSACSKKGGNVATVNGKSIPNWMLEDWLAELERGGRKRDDKLEAQIKEELINRAVLSSAAEKQGLTKSETVRFQTEMARQAILIRELFSQFEKTNAVKDDEIKAEYERLKKETPSNEYSARHILLDKEDAAKAIIAKLKSGARFEALAKAQSKDPNSAKDGGSLGWARADTYVKEFADALGKLKKGEVTQQPVKTQFGFHVIRLDDVRTTEFLPFAQVEPQIKQSLMQAKLENYRKEIIAAAKVK